MWSPLAASRPVDGFWQTVVQISYTHAVRSGFAFTHIETAIYNEAKPWFGRFQQFTAFGLEVPTQMA